MGEPLYLKAQKGVVVDGRRVFVVDEIYDAFQTDSLAEYSQVTGSWSYDSSNNRIESADQIGPQEVVLDSVGFEGAVYHADVYIPSGASNTDKAGITFNFIDGDNYYRATLDQSAGLVAFKKNVGGSGNNALTYTNQTISTDTWYRLTVYRRDDGLTRIYLDDERRTGDPLVEGRDSDSALIDGGRAGVFTQAAQARFDNLRFEPTRTRRVTDVPKKF